MNFSYLDGYLIFGI